MIRSKIKTKGPNAGGDMFYESTRNGTLAILKRRLNNIFRGRRVEGMASTEADCRGPPA